MAHSPATTSGTRAALPGLLVAARTLVFSFDGPICALSPELARIGAADRLRDLVVTYGHPVPDELRTVDDPLPVLRYAAIRDSGELNYDADYETSLLERDAMAVAAPTPGAHEAIRAARSASKAVALATDRSGWAIEQYLKLHDLAEAIPSPVVGRYTHAPLRWKPDTFPLLLAVLRTGADAGSALFIGATVLDAGTATAAGVPFLGLAGLRASTEELWAAGAEHVLSPDGMLLIAAALRELAASA